MDQGAMMRYLNEMMWFPSAFLGENISFEAIDSNSAKVILKDLGKSVTAVMYFDSDGKLTNFIAPCYEIWEIINLNWKNGTHQFGNLGILKE
jgi:hypothetical protein